MLIYTSKSPGWGKQKPKQWGPLSAVRSAVFANAERMGMPIPSSYFPLNEISGAPQDIISGQQSITAPSWTNNGIKVESSSNIVPTFESSDNYDLSGQAYSLVMHFNAASSQSNWCGFISKGNPSDSINDWVVQRNSSTQNIRLYHGFPSTDFIDAFPSIIGGERIVVLTWDKSMASLYIDGRIFVSQSFTAYPQHTQARSVRLQSSRDPLALVGVGYQYQIYKTALTPTHIAQLHETPYALLQPVPQPYYFDMGAVSTGPVLVAPADTSTPMQPVTLEWQAYTGAVNYEYQVSSDNLYATIVQTGITASTSKQLDMLNPGTYYWRVRAQVAE